MVFNDLLDEQVMGLNEVSILRFWWGMNNSQYTKNKECIWGFIMSLINKLKSFSRFVNRPSDTNLRLVFTEEDNITNDFEIVFIVRS